MKDKCCYNVDNLRTCFKTSSFNIWDKGHRQSAVPFVIEQNTRVIDSGVLLIRFPGPCGR